jgi:hypothetical protein
MKRVIAVFSLIVGAFFQLSAQSPYWQQSVDYIIDVTLDDEMHMLRGTESFIYHNKSKESLDRIYVHLWANAYRDNRTAFARQQLANRSWKFYTAPDSMRGFIDSLDFKVDNRSVKWEYLADDTPDVAIIWLNQPLAPGQRLTVSTPFRVKLPGDFSRMGHDGQQYQITQWYPKPAVFDHTGWHYMPYLDLGEFFSEFGSFEVTIRVPENYKVAASGNLQNSNERAWLDSLATAHAQLDSFPVLEEASSPRYKALRYTLDQVHDFAWFASKHYYVHKSQVLLPNSGKKVSTFAFFDGGKSASRWKEAVKYVDSSVYYYSKWIGDYPYEYCTAVQGALSAGGGMEYPTITVISAGGSDRELDLIIAHEVGHNWFYGILASNERDYPWLDEGVNSYYEARYVKQRYPDTTDTKAKVEGFGLRLDGEDLDQLAWLFSARRGKDVALWNTPSQAYDSETYGTLVYKKTALQLNYLAAYLGQENFDKRMQAYYQQWKFKHPSPADFQKAMESGEGDRNVRWFFEQQLQSAGAVDYRIRRVKKINDNQYAVKIAGLGNSGPFSLAALDDTGAVLRKEWFAGFSGTQTHLIAVNGAHKFVIDPDEEMPLYMRPRAYAKLGNWWPAIPAIQPLLGLGMNDNKMYLLPVVGANTANGFMLGAALYSSIVLPQDFEYALVPMYGFGSKTLAGSARLRYNWHPSSGFFGRIQVGITARKYETFGLDGALIQYYVKGRLPKTNSSTRYQHMQLRLTQRLSRDVFMAGINQEFLPQFTYEWEDVRIRNPWSVKADVLAAFPVSGHAMYTSAAARLAVEAKFRWNYLPKYKMYWQHRVFAAYSLTDNPTSMPLLNSMSAVDGSQDYLGDAVFFDRTPLAGNGIGGRQLMQRDAAMRVANGHWGNTIVGLQPINWLLAWNTDLKIPKVPLVLFADLSLSNLNGQNLTLPLTTLADLPFPAFQTESLTYAGGIAFQLFNGGFSVNFPLLMSKSLTYHPITDQTLGILDQISFSIDLFKLNPYDLVRDLKL